MEINPVIAIIMLIATVEACAQFCLKTGHDQKNKNLYFFGFSAYAFVGYLLLKSYNFEGVAYCNILWSALSIILACISGSIFFGEKINYLAVFLALGSVYVINQSK